MKNLENKLRRLIEHQKCFEQTFKKKFKNKKQKELTEEQKKMKKKQMDSAWHIPKCYKKHDEISPAEKQYIRKEMGKLMDEFEKKDRQLSNQAKEKSKNAKNTRKGLRQEEHD